MTSIYIFSDFLLESIYTKIGQEVCINENDLVRSKVNLIFCYADMGTAYTWNDKVLSFIRRMVASPCTDAPIFVGIAHNIHQLQ